MTTDITYFSTNEADECFMNEFVLATSLVMEGEINKAAELYI